MSGARRQARPAQPVLVRQVRGGIVESEHRGSIVVADADGRISLLVGDADLLVTLRSAVKPFGTAALVQAGGIEAFELSSDELAVMTASHAGEDLHVRTVQGLLRRAGVPQSALACGTEGMPLDTRTAARLVRDGEQPSAIRHMCSGHHAMFLLLSKLRGWPLEGYWQDDHPAQVAHAEAVATAFGTTRGRLVSAIDGCGIPTYAFPLREVARAFAFLADPGAVAASDPRAAVAPALSILRDAMHKHPDLVGGTRDRLDTALMKTAPGRLVSKGGAEALRGVALLPGPAGRGRARGMALKIEDGDGRDRASTAATVEALAQAGVLDDAAVRSLGRYHRPPSLDPHGRVAAEAIASFEFAPVGELFR